MLMKNESQAQQTAQTNAIYASLLVSISVLIALVAFSESLLELIRRWTVQEEYSHGFLIPFIVAWLLWTRRHALLASVGRPSWIGPALILLAAVLHIIGKLSALFILPQVAFVIVLIGIALGLGGYSLLKVTFIPIIFPANNKIALMRVVFMHFKIRTFIFKFNSDLFPSFSCVPSTDTIWITRFNFFDIHIEVFDHFTKQKNDPVFICGAIY